MEEVFLSTSFVLEYVGTCQGCFAGTPTWCYDYFDRTHNNTDIKKILTTNSRR